MVTPAKGCEPSYIIALSTFHQSANEEGFRVKNSLTKRKILAHISRVTGQKRIELDRSFKEYSIDSITTLELLMDLEREFNITIPDEKIEQLVTPRALIDLVETLLTLHVS